MNVFQYIHMLCTQRSLIRTINGNWCGSLAGALTGSGGRRPTDVVAQAAAAGYKLPTIHSYHLLLFYHQSNFLNFNCHNLNLFGLSSSIIKSPITYLIRER